MAGPRYIQRHPDQSVLVLLAVLVGFIHEARADTASRDPSVAAAVANPRASLADYRSSAPTVVATVADTGQRSVAVAPSLEATQSAPTALANPASIAPTRSAAASASVVAAATNPGPSPDSLADFATQSVADKRSLDAAPLLAAAGSDAAVASVAATPSLAANLSVVATPSVAANPSVVATPSDVAPPSVGATPSAVVAPAVAAGAAGNADCETVEQLAHAENADPLTLLLSFQKCMRVVAQTGAELQELDEKNQAAVGAYASSFKHNYNDLASVVKFLSEEFEPTLATKHNEMIKRIRNDLTESVKYLEDNW